MPSALLMAERPDLIVLGGDYVNWQDRVLVGSCAEALETLHAPHGVFAVFGNHDDERTTRRRSSAGASRCWRDERTRRVVGGETLELAGLRYWTRRITDIARMLRASTTAPRLLLAHDPRRLAEAATLDVPPCSRSHSRRPGRAAGVGAIAARKFPVVARRRRRREHVASSSAVASAPSSSALPAELPARGGGGDARTEGNAEPSGGRTNEHPQPSRKNRRPSSRQRPSRTIPIASG